MVDCGGYNGIRVCLLVEFHCFLDVKYCHFRSLFPQRLVDGMSIKTAWSDPPFISFDFSCTLQKTRLWFIDFFSIYARHGPATNASNNQRASSTKLSFRAFHVSGYPFDTHHHRAHSRVNNPDIPSICRKSSHYSSKLCTQSIHDLSNGDFNTPINH